LGRRDLGYGKTGHCNTGHGSTGHADGGGGRARNLWRRRGLKQSGRDGLENHCGLQAGFDAAGDNNSFEAAVTELCRIGVESVGSCIERGKSEDAVLRRTGADFGTGGLVAQNECDAGERGRMKIGKAAGEGA
jgi:hypothetical protein